MLASRTFIGRVLNRAATIALCVGIALIADQAYSANLVNHTFEFNIRRDSPGIELLDYRYGDSKIYAARANPESVAKGKIRQQLGITGEMRRPESLYMKWR